jgi:hypothetical protein
MFAHCIFSNTYKRNISHNFSFIAHINKQPISPHLYATHLYATHLYATHLYATHLYATHPRALHGHTHTMARIWRVEGMRKPPSASVTGNVSSNAQDAETTPSSAAQRRSHLRNMNMKSTQPLHRLPSPETQRRITNSFYADEAIRAKYQNVEPKTHGEYKQLISRNGPKSQGNSHHCESFRKSSHSSLPGNGNEDEDCDDNVSVVSHLSECVNLWGEENRNSEKSEPAWSINSKRNNITFSVRMEGYHQWELETSCLRPGIEWRSPPREVTGNQPVLRKRVQTTFEEPGFLEGHQELGGCNVCPVIRKHG